MTPASDLNVATRAAEVYPIYRFGDCEVIPRLRQVRRGGVLSESQPKAFDLLLYLIVNRDRVVDKDELLAKLWPGSVVSESALTQVVRKARSLVGDDGSRQSVIRTLQRRGFRFIASIEGEGGIAVAGALEQVRGYADTPSSHSSPDPSVRAAASRDARVTAERSNTAPAVAARAVAEYAVAETTVAEPSVAVLPFVDMSPERDQEYFCDGMAEEITNELAHVPGLRVAARTSTFAFKNRPDDVRNIGRHLGVKSVLEGSVRKAGDRLRVTAQLVDADTGFHLWSERWDRRFEDMLAIQDEIAHRIAEALRRPQKRPSVVTSRFTSDDLCERGFAYLHRYGRRSQRFAMDFFRQALAIDPASARACAGLALSHAVLFRTVAEKHREEAAAAAVKATELDPRSAEAWTARGAAASIARDFAGAEAAFEHAIDCDPLLFEARYYYGHACIEVGEYSKAAALYERAAELRPDDYQALVFARQAYRSLGEPERERDAATRQLAAAERALAADPTDARALSLSAGSLIAMGRASEARTWCMRACELEPDEPYVHYNAACAFALLGEIESRHGHAGAALIRHAPTPAPPRRYQQAGE